MWEESRFSGWSALFPGHLRPYSSALSVLDEEDATSYLLSPNIHGPLGLLYFLDVQDITK
jgi:hypothetical protein